MAPFSAPDRSLFFSRQDPNDPRLGDLVRPNIDDGVAIIGYPDDEGIRINGGREGARLGPQEVRRWLYKTTPDSRRAIKNFTDLGDLDLNHNQNRDLAGRHESGTHQVFSVLQKGLQVLSLGGGNDYAFSDGMAFLKKYEKQKPLVINVDAHLDVRSTSKGLSSGTPFYRLLESGIAFDFVEFGIQGLCNAKIHREYVLKKSGKILDQEGALSSGIPLLEFTVREMGEWMVKSRPCFLAIDIDAFALPYAAGSSAAWPLGLRPHDFLPVFNAWLKRLDVRVLGLYEVSPPLDPGLTTVKWAAQLAHGFLHHV